MSGISGSEGGMSDDDMMSGSGDSGSDEDSEGEHENTYDDEDDEGDDEPSADDASDKPQKKKKKTSKPREAKLDPYLLRREATLMNLVTKHFKDRVIIFFNEKIQCHRMLILFKMYGLKAVEVQGNLTQ